MLIPLKLLLAACALVVVATISAQPAAAQMTVNQSLDGIAPGYDSGGYVGLTLQQLMLALGVAMQGQGGRSGVFDANMRLSNRLAPRAAKADEPPAAPRLAAAPDETVPVE